MSPPKLLQYPCAATYIYIHCIAIGSGHIIMIVWVRAKGPNESSDLHMLQMLK